MKQAVLHKWWSALCDHAVQTFGFEDTTEFTNSFLHTKCMTFTIIAGIVAGLSEHLFGLKPMTLIAFVVLMIAELVSGIAASVILKIKISSHRFSRFILKVTLWLACLFILNSLANQYSDGSVVNELYAVMHTMMMAFVTMEYFISVIENIGVISGKSNIPLLQWLRSKTKKITEL